MLWHQKCLSKIARTFDNSLPALVIQVSSVCNARCNENQYCNRSLCVDCQDACTSCDATGNCTSCDSDYFLYSNDTGVTCVACLSAALSNVTVSPFGDEFSFCAMNCTISHAIETPADCDSLCGEEAPRNDTQDSVTYTTICTSCSNVSYRIDKCECCVAQCPHLYEPNDSNVCVRASVKPPIDGGSDSNTGRTRTMLVIIGVVIGSIVVVTILLAAWCVWYRRHGGNFFSRKKSKHKLPSKQDLDDMRKVRSVRLKNMPIMRSVRLEVHAPLYML